MTIENIVDHLKIRYPSYNPIRLYPFDLEDAIMIWCNQCIHEMNSKSQHSLRLEEIDDFVVGLKDGMITCQIIQLYFPQVESFMNENDPLHAICNDVGLNCPWSQKEFESSDNPAHLKSLLLCLFCDMFDLIQRTTMSDSDAITPESHVKVNDSVEKIMDSSDEIINAQETLSNHNDEELNDNQTVEFDSCETENEP